MKVILSCVDGSPSSDAGIDAASWLASRLHARIRVLHVIDIRLLEGPWMTDLVGSLGAQPYQAAVPQVRHLLEERAETIIAAAKSRAGEFVDTAETVTGLVVDRILGAERCCDIVVLGQKGEHARWLVGWVGSTSERVVRKSVKPCLVVPEPFQPARSLVVGYDGSPFAVRALGIACDLATRLDLPIRVVTVAEHRDAKEVEAASKEAAEYARHHSVSCETIVREGEPEEVLIEVSGIAPEAWIIIGAFGHARVRELLLGSTTSEVLRRSGRPVLLTR
jgi:nucleotide-binding universal stress UspA family protein